MDDPAVKPPTYWTGSRVVAAALMSALLLGLGGWGAWVRTADPAGPLLFVDAPNHPATNPSPSFNLDNLQVPEDQIHSGGVRKDGIPSITDPPTQRASDQTQWPGETRIVGVVVNGEARAYALPHLNYHECVNDTLGGVPIAVTFCPLCDSVSVFDRRPAPDAEPLVFGISGRLMNSNVLLYDRTDDALWSQVGMRAISGPHAGKTLRHMAGWSLGPLSAFVEKHPQATVMLADESNMQRYRHDVYADRGYFESDEVWFPLAHTDARLPLKERIIGLFSDERALAVKMSDVLDAGPGGLRVSFGEGVAVLRSDEKNAIAIDQLPGSVSAMHTFWFAWAAFHPETSIFGMSPVEERTP